ncbi:MAG TPA: S8 family serine peptidase [Chloroflexota bacterium]
MGLELFSLPVWGAPSEHRLEATRGIAVAVTVVLSIASGLVGASPAHADDWRDREWQLDFLRAEEVNNISEGDGVAVAVVDTGVNGNHPDLTGSVLKGTDFAGGDGWRDTEGHGTAMASLIAGHGHGTHGQDGIRGLAPKAKILPISGDSRHGLESKLLRQAKVLNLSLGRGGLELAINDAFKADLVVIAAAGNTDQGDSGVQAPANHPGVIAVSGVDESGDFTNKSVQGPEVVLSAPAVHLAGAWAGNRGNYAVATGTSGAAALVSGTAALIRAKYPNISANGVINRLISTADDKGTPGRDPKYGYGVVNPLRALTADVPDLKYNPLLKGAPGPTVTPTKAAGGSPADGNSHANIGLTLAIIAGMVALAIIATGVVVLTRNRNR